MNKIAGAIYPIPTEFVNRIFDGKDKVFVKYVAHNTTKLASRHKIVFYASHGLKKLVGEGTIESVEFLTPDDVLAKFKNELFLDEVELRAYVRERPSRTSKKMLTLTLRKLRKYKEFIYYDKPITMAGQYLSAEQYDSLAKNRKR